MAEKLQAIAALPAGVTPPKALQYGNQHGLVHLPPLVHPSPRTLRFLPAIQRTGNYSAAAAETDGVSNTARAFRKLAKDDPRFAKAVFDALESYGAVIAAAVHEAAVTGVDEPIVSMGEVVAHKRVRDTRLLGQLYKVHSAEFKKANEAQSAVNVQINNGANPNPDDPNNPSWTLYLADTWTLSLQDREHLARIVGTIMTARLAAESPVAIDFPPPDFEDADFETVDEGNPYGI